MKILITGGAGFIGSALIRNLIQNSDDVILAVDKLTYAGNLNALATVSSHKRFFFEKADICSATTMGSLFQSYQPDAVMHLAAETHVDRSIVDAGAFIQTNIIGTYVLLETAHEYWQSLSDSRKEHFRFHHVSTDEVYGDLEDSPDLFTETRAYAPSSPYSASKASSDHLVRAWHRTHGLPVIITHSSNNYGPYQLTEKLIPLMIRHAIAGKPLPVYGQGLSIRDWIYVDDHVRALYQVLLHGKIGETYNIGGNQEKRNIDVIHSLCSLLEEMAPIKPSGITHYRDLIAYVQDRPGHDQRYAIDTTKIKQALDWAPKETFETGLRKTVQWYLQNLAWFNGEGERYPPVSHSHFSTWASV